MKKIIIYSLLALVAMSSCESFLDTENLTKKDSSNFPENESDMEASMAAIYAAIAGINSTETIFLAGDIASDNRFGGGGQNDRGFQALTRLKRDGQDHFNNSWRNNYKGINRANNLLENVDRINWSSEEQRNAIEGEARFLRGHIYFDLARFFGRVPLVLTTEMVNLPRAEADELFAQIALDLKLAIELLPSIPYSPANNKHLGRATKWAAEALMARVFLFYTGYYRQESLPVAGSSEVIRKEQVISWLEECAYRSGHGLAKDFRGLWPYSNPATNVDYPYAREVVWEGETGDNIETIFAYKYSILATYDNTQYSNPIILTSSLRNGGGQDYEKTFPYGPGWGAGPVNSQLWDDWLEKEPEDIRRQASILDVRDPEEIEGYSWGEDRMMEETGYWNKKYIAINAHQKKEDGSIELVKYGCVLYNRTPDYKLDNTQDLVLIRYADVLLMLSELKKEAGPMNEVRARVGLPPVSYTEENLRQERRFELAFEGVRYYDLLRWHLAETELAKQHGVEVMNNGVKGYIDLSDLGKRVRETGGFFPIPQTQIELSAGVLVQDPAWTTQEAIFTGQ
ncbi:MAG: RagB/SusD family nutrient uptake outer membrane protein [Tannerellaceae bacterium]|nr:RagB/SusD family nutrient uptake outer membrane protein [Tannerellaceae bacterium]